MVSTLGQNAEKISMELPLSLNRILKMETPDISYYDDCSVMTFAVMPGCDIEDAMNNMDDDYDMYLVLLALDRTTGFVHGCFMTDPSDKYMLKADFIVGKDNKVRSFVASNYESIDCYKAAIDRVIAEHGGSNFDITDKIQAEYYERFFM